MSERLIADYGAATCWEHTPLAGSNRFICVHTQTHISLSPLTGRIHQHVESQMNINPPRGAAPLSPGSAAWRSAHRLLLSCGRGNYPPFCVCVCLWVLVSMVCSRVWRLHRYYLSYLFSALAAGQSAYLTGGLAGWSCFPPGSWARQFCGWDCSRSSITRRAARGGT